MTKDGTENLHKLLRKARIDAGLTQAALAAQVGCKQSAVSMMEAGRPEALSRESLEKLAKVLNVTLPEAVDAKPLSPTSGAGPAVCPGFNCPSNLPYAVGGEVFFMPLGTAGSGRGAEYAQAGHLRYRAGRSRESPLPRSGAAHVR